MPDLHPEVLALIAAGPDATNAEFVSVAQARFFARRIALRAVELEREECAKVCEELQDAWGKCAAAIRRRGKP